MSVSRADLDHIASLAHLRLEEDEAERLTGDLNSILGHVDALREAGAEAGRGLAVGPQAAPERGAGDLPRDELSRPPGSFAPDWREGLFVVPRLPGHGVAGAPPPEYRPEEAGS